MSKTMNSTDSPGWATFRLRFRAFLIDAGICLGLFLVGGIAAAALFEGSPVGRVVAFFAIIACIISYEPFMLSRYGGTLGHTVLNLRVVQVQTHRNLPLRRGFVRTLTKMLFGIFSFVFMFVTNRAQALHDLAAGSEVRIRDPKHAARGDYFVPSPPLSAESGLSPVRRLVGIVLYNFLLFVFTAIAAGLSVSQGCIELDICSGADRQTLDLLSYAWLVGCGVSIILGWTGRLPGFRRRRLGRGEVGPNGG